MATEGKGLLPLHDMIWTAANRLQEMADVVKGARDTPVGTTPKDVVWRKNKARLYRYKSEQPAKHRTPVFLTMPLINRAYILDLRPGASLVAFLLSQGFDVFLLDWGLPGDEDRNLDLDVYITKYLDRALRKASQAAGGVDVTLLGYCIGGALATCYMALYHQDAPVKNLILFTTPIDFTDAGLFGKWTAKEVFPIDRLADTWPVIPSQIPETGSKMLTPLPSSLGVYMKLLGKLGDPKFDVAGWQAMYRWVNDGVPFTGAAYRQWIEEFYQDNKLVKGTLQMAGKTLSLSDITCPILNVVASEDNIAPRPTTEAILKMVGSTDRQELVVKGGHVGIVVGRAAQQTLWPGVAAWLEKHD